MTKEKATNTMRTVSSLDHCCEGDEEEQEEDVIACLWVDAEGVCHIFDDRQLQEEKVDCDRPTISNRPSTQSYDSPCFVSDNDASPPLQAPTNRPKFEIGDHVSKWCSIPGVQENAYEHHGIVLDVQVGPNGLWKMKIADFSYWAQQHQQQEEGRQNGSWTQTAMSFFRQQMQQDESASLNGDPNTTTTNNRSNNNVENSSYGLRTYEIPDNDPVWTRVAYDHPTTGYNDQQSDYTAANLTSAHCDDVPLVLQRVLFLLSHPEHVPSYDLLEANCECVAVWCKTGTWCTLQVLSRLSDFAERNQQILWEAAKSRVISGLWDAMPTVAAAATGMNPPPSAAARGATAAATAASGPTITTSSGGVSAWWAFYGVTAVLTPKLLLWHTQQQWKEQTEHLNAVFWEHNSTSDRDEIARSGHIASSTEQVAVTVT